MPDLIGSLLFVTAVGLSGAKINEDFGNRGLRGYAVFMVIMLIYAAAIAFAFA